jgi:hypothetical protein
MVSAGGPVAAPLAAFVHARTDGNALFMVNILEHLVRQGLVARGEGEWTLRAGAETFAMGPPEGVQQLIVRRLEELPPEARRVLSMMARAEQEGFGSCTNIGECEAACPKGIRLDFIARLNRDYIKASLLKSTIAN